MVKKLLYLSTIYAGLSALVKGISFIAIILIAKYFSTEQYAIFALLFSIHQGVASFSIAGINESVIGFLKENKKSKKQRRVILKCFSYNHSDNTDCFFIRNDNVLLLSKAKKS